MKKIIYLTLIITSFLTACSGETPSNDDFHNSLNSSIQTVNDQIILNTIQSFENSAVYMLQNTSMQSIYINHPADHPGTASAGWASRLDPKQWSALVLDKSKFAITCHAILSNDKIKNVPCSKVLNMKLVTIKSNQQGSYWIAENLTYEQLQQKIKERGFILNS